MLEMRLAPPVSKYLKKLKDKKLRELFKNALDGICENPYIGKLKKGDLSGIYGYDLYYQRTNYEIAYVIEEKSNENIIVVIMAGTRENFYEQLKNYLRWFSIKINLLNFSTKINFSEIPKNKIPEKYYSQN